MFSTCPSVRHLTWKHTYFENKWTDFDANWHKWSVCTHMKQSTAGVRRSKVKVTGGQNRSNLWTRYFRSWFGHKLAQVVHGPRAWKNQLWELGQKFKGQGHRRLNDYLEAWRRHQSWPPLLGRLGFPVKHDIDAEPRIEDTHFPTTAMSISQFCPYQNPTGFSASCSGTSERSSATTNRKSTLYICSNTNAFWHNALTDVIYILNTFAVLYCDFKMLVHKQMKCICQQSALQSAQDCK